MKNTIAHIQFRTQIILVGIFSISVFFIAHSAFGGVTPPGTPRSVSVAPDNMVAVVTFSPPLDGCSAPTVCSYKITGTYYDGVSPVAKVVSMSTQTSPGRLGLPNCISATITIQASNSGGNGIEISVGSVKPAPPGGCTGSTTNTPPSVPTGVSAAAGNKQAVITWSPPSKDGGTPVLNYTVTVNPTGAFAPRTVSASGGKTGYGGQTYSYTFDGLNNGDSYSFNITATNAAGTGIAAQTGTVQPSEDATSTTIGDSGDNGTSTGDGSTSNGTTSGGTTTNGGTATAGNTKSGGDASSGDGTIKIDIKNPLPGSKDLVSLVAIILKAIAELLFPIVVIMMLYSGFLFVTAQGQTEKITKAREALLYTVIGAAVVLGASGLAILIQNVIVSVAK